MALIDYFEKRREPREIEPRAGAREWAPQIDPAQSGKDATEI